MNTGLTTPEMRTNSCSLPMATCFSRKQEIAVAENLDDGSGHGTVEDVPVSALPGTPRRPWYWSIEAESLNALARQPRQAGHFGGHRTGRSILALDVVDADVLSVMVTVMVSPPTKRAR